MQLPIIPYPEYAGYSINMQQKGIEPISPVPQTGILPLNYCCSINISHTSYYLCTKWILTLVVKFTFPLANTRRRPDIMSTSYSVSKLAYYATYSGLECIQDIGYGLYVIRRYGHHRWPGIA